MIVLQTERLRLIEFQIEDTDFILQLLNDPGWLRFIGDRGVRNVAQAKKYLQNGPIKSYAEHGFGLYAIERKDGREKVGMCGLIKRPQLEDVDIGYALLAAHTGKGYAFEAAKATLDFAVQKLQMKRVVAITDPDNDRSAQLLRKLGMVFEKKLQIFDGLETSLFVYQRTTD